MTTSQQPHLPPGYHLWDPGRGNRILLARGKRIQQEIQMARFVFLDLPLPVGKALLLP